MLAAGPRENKVLKCGVQVCRTSICPAALIRVIHAQSGDWGGVFMPDSLQRKMRSWREEEL
jgi:hypothetical protein